ncbi:hypothetical protein EDC94DRAFT_651645 [Helicostylum pulchrum]|uniref:Uncharacterized protein n=1 Tax=Helicostylum pulchrum TaxID=562976 RepID=A0ABP9Y1R6_9FUNG|nr:hypothetical protein EDC94DRAFT_651645 [Helicostylum pulchrum]
MYSKFLRLMLMALVFTVACAAVPVTTEPTIVNYSGNSTDILGKNATRAMGCKTKGNTKICTDQNRNALVDYDSFEHVNDHFLYRLPDWKETNSYEFCISGACGAMTTLSGSQFVPNEYKDAAIKALDRLYETQYCISNMGTVLHPSAVDVYLYDLNFVISFWFNSVDYFKC